MDSFIDYTMCGRPKDTPKGVIPHDPVPDSVPEYVSDPEPLVQV